MFVLECDVPRAVANGSRFSLSRFTQYEIEVKIPSVVQDIPDSSSPSSNCSSSATATGYPTGKSSSSSMAKKWVPMEDENLVRKRKGVTADIPLSVENPELVPVEAAKSQRTHRVRRRFSQFLAFKRFLSTLETLPEQEHLSNASSALFSAVHTRLDRAWFSRFNDSVIESRRAFFEDFLSHLFLWLADEDNQQLNDEVWEHVNRFLDFNVCHVIQQSHNVRKSVRIALGMGFSTTIPSMLSNPRALVLPSRLLGLESKAELDLKENHFDPASTTTMTLPPTLTTTPSSFLPIGFCAANTTSGTKATDEADNALGLAEAKLRLSRSKHGELRVGIADMFSQLLVTKKFLRSSEGSELLNLEQQVASMQLHIASLRSLDEDDSTDAGDGGKCTGKKRGMRDITNQSSSM